MKQWLLLIAFLFTIGQNAEAQNSRKATILCNSNTTLYDVDLGTACIEGTKDERAAIIKDQIKAITNFNNAFVAAKISSLFICDNSNCPDPLTMDCNKSAKVLRVKTLQRKISDDKYEVKYLGVIRVICSMCDAASGGTGICGDDTFIKPVDVLVECGTSLEISLGPASLFINGSLAQANALATAAAQAATNYYTNFPDQLPVNAKCYDIICDPGEICISTQSLVTVVSQPPVQVDDNPPCYRLDFYLTVRIECSVCEEEKEEKEPEELSTIKTPSIIDNIYPNPVRDYVMIELTETELDTPKIGSRLQQNVEDDITIHLADLQGKILQTALLTNGERSIAISVNNMADGIHFILIESDGKIIERRKIIIQNN